MTRSTVIVGALVALLSLVPSVATGQSVDAELDLAQQRSEELRERRDELVGRVEAARVEAEQVADELAELERQEVQLAREVVEVDERLAARAREYFKHGATGTIEQLLGADSPTAGLERASLFSTIQTRETAGLEDALAIRASLDQTRALAADHRDRLAALDEELAAAVNELQAELSTAELIVDSLEQMSARQRSISRGDQQGTYACPLDPGATHFIDSWGFPRSGGRRHQGTDVMGPMGANVYAFTSGVIARQSNSRLGGISLYLRGDDGSTYFYTHLQGFAPRGAVGTRVHAGEHIAYNGNTGNARGGAPHIHFERHPGGGGAVNPYQWLAAACF